MINLRPVLLVVVTLAIATAGAVAQATSDPTDDHVGVTLSEG